MLRIRLATLFCWLAFAAPAFALEADDIVRQAMDHYRGQSSRADMAMIIHRPDWERSMRMQAWTAGDEKTLVRVTEPRKDVGIATLSVNSNMWTFSPRINRVLAPVLTSGRRCCAET